MNIMLQFRIKEADVNCQSLRKYEKLLWFCFSALYVLHSEHSSDTHATLPFPHQKKKQKPEICQTPKKAESLRNPKNSLKIRQHIEKGSDHISKPKKRTSIPG